MQHNLVKQQAQSHIEDFFQLNNGNVNDTLTNGPIYIECKTLRHVVASSIEAKTAGVFHNTQIALPIWYILDKMGHSQRPTLIKNW